MVTAAAMRYRLFLVAASCLMLSCSATNTGTTTSIRRRVKQTKQSSSTTSSNDWYDKVEHLPWWEERSDFIDFPDSATEALREEKALIPLPLGLDVTTRVSNLDETFAVWSLLKGIVHRFRRQNQIIHVNPHYYIGTGVEEGCRKLELDVDTGLEVEIQLVPPPPHCERDCTNQGRYCVTPPQSDDATSTSNDTTTSTTGVEIIEETLRLICFDQIYSASDLRFNEYLDALETLGCHDNTNTNGEDHISWESCSHQAMYHLSRVSKTSIDNCVALAGGTTDDVMNVHLQHEVDRRKNKAFYTAQDLPIIQVAGQQYRQTTFTSMEEHWSAKSIFAFVCQVYRDETENSPLGCQVCEGCGNVRKCLWTLECDGQPFDMAELEGYVIGQEDTAASSGETEPPEMITLEPTASTATSRPLALITTPSSAEIINPPAKEEDEEEKEEPTEDANYESEEEPTEDANSPSDEVPTAETAGVSQQEDFDTVESGPLPPHPPAPSPSSPNKTKPAKNSTSTESEAQFIGLGIVSAVCILTAVLVVICCFFRSQRGPDSLTERYIDSIQARWMWREQDKVPGDGSNEGVGLPPGDLRRADSHKTEYRSFWDFFKRGDEKPRRSLHANVNKFASKKRIKRQSLNAGRRYSKDGARSIQETLAAFSNSIKEASFNSSFTLDFSSNSLNFSSHSGHTRTKPKKKIEARRPRYGKSHAAALAEAAASGQTPPRIPSTLTRIPSTVKEETAEEMINSVPGNTPDHLKYSPNWEAGYSPGSPDNSNPSLNSGSNTDPLGSSTRSTKRFGREDSVASLYDDDEEDVAKGLQDVTML